MNNIVITGSTGVLGRRAVRELLAAGHHVSGVTRSLRGRRLLEGLGARAVDADVFDPASLTTAFAGADTVVNLLTHVPPPARMMAPGAWDERAASAYDRYLAALDDYTRPGLVIATLADEARKAGIG